MTYITMYDAVSYGNIPHSAEAVAGYIDGAYANFDALVKTFPNAKHLSIATGAGYTAQFLDVESGDAVIADTPGWLDRMLASGIYRPGIYANKAYWEEGGMGRLLDHYGDKIRRWQADWTFGEHVPDGYDACQWSGGQTLDISATLEDFFGAVAVRDPNHYDWFYSRDFKIDLGWTNERKVVEEYDVARRHPARHSLYLRRNLRPRLHQLAERVAHVAIYNEKDEKRKHPEWDRDFRGWRYQQLLGRSEGKIFAK
jgi:hypothetical protein